MEQIRINLTVAISGDWFSGYGIADLFVAEHIHQICEEIFQITCPLN